MEMEGGYYQVPIFYSKYLKLKFESNIVVVACLIGELFVLYLL